MAVLQAILLLILRSIGRLLNTVFGWAMVMLFGRVPRRRHTTLIVMLVVSIVWLICVVGVAAPRVALYLLAFAQLPDDVDHGLVRVLLLIATIALPLVVSLLTLRLPQSSTPSHRHRAFLRTLLSGYPTTLGLGLTLVMLLVLVPVMKLRAVLAGQTTQHVPMIVDAADYREVVADLQATLEREGWKTACRPMSWTLRVPTLILAVLAGRTLERRIAEELITLWSPKLEVILHPSGALIRGTDNDIVRVRAAIVEHLAFSKAYMTWDRTGHAIEQRLTDVWLATRRGGLTLQEGMARLSEIEHALRSAELPYDEWEILYRETLLVERALLAAAIEHHHMTETTANPKDSHATDPNRNPMRPEHVPLARHP